LRVEFLHTIMSSTHKVVFNQNNPTKDVKILRI
jgi:hypothetical protein